VSDVNRKGEEAGRERRGRGLGIGDWGCVVRLVLLALTVPSAEFFDSLDQWLHWMKADYEEYAL
jgi:hypothetical protein